MALFRKLFFRKPPDGLLEISERIYVFDCCFTTDAWEEEDYKVYTGGIIGQLREIYPDASIMVFNFREGETESQMAKVLSEYDMTIMDYPRHYEGCPLLSLEVMHHFLRSSESWLSLGQQNVLLMHCERGGWPVLAFMLAALLIYKKQYAGEQRTLDMIYKQAPPELLYLLSPLNPIPSQIRYLQYVSRRNVASEWPPLNQALTLDCVIIRLIPKFDSEGGCRPFFRIYGQDPFLVADRSPKLLFSTPKKSKTIRHYKQVECELVKIDINCLIQGDVVLECISLHEDMEREEMMFRVMFNTAFIRSNILILNRDEVDMLWNAKDQFPKDFRAEVLFSDAGSVASVVSVDLSCFEHKDGLPVEAFAKVQEIFNSVDWLAPKIDASLNIIQQIAMSNVAEERSDTHSYRGAEPTISPGLSPGKPHEYSSKLLSPKGGQSVPSSELFTDRVEQQTEPKPVSISPPTPPPPAPFRPSICDSAGEPVPPTSPLVSKYLTTSQPLHISPGERSETFPGGHSSEVASSAVETLPLGAISNNLSSTLSSPSTSLLIASSMTPLPAPSLKKDLAIQLKSSPPASPPPTAPPISTAFVKNSPVDTRKPRSPPPPPSPATHPTQPSNNNKIAETGTYPSPSPPALPSPSTSSLIGNQAVRIGSPANPPPPPPPPPLPKNESTIRAGPPPPPPLPPPTPSLKNESTTRAGPLPPPPPPPPPSPPLKNESTIRARPPPPHPPTPSLKNDSTIRVGPPPPPPPPPPTSPLKNESIIRRGPPPPPPLPSGQHTGSTVSPSVPLPPPPPAPSSSSRMLENVPQNSSRVPAAPPPPAPSMKPSNNGDQNLSKPNSPAPPTPAPPLGAPSSARERGLSRTMVSRNSQIKKLKPLHWLKLTRAVQGSLWAEAQKSGEAAKAPEIDMSELENLFSAAVPTSEQGGSHRRSGSRASLGQKSEKVQLIEHRRAYNCEIMLSKVKIPLHELMGSVLALEDSALDVDQVDNLIKFCPTKEEMELLKGYNGEKEKLGKCEQFFLELMQVPRIESKLRVFSFKMQFRSQVSDLRKSLNVVNSAAEQIRSSAKFKQVMQTILSLGNALNQGTARGSAVGFRLDSLLKLTETRARNNKMTLMHYLCKVLADKLPELLDFSEDLACLEPASKIQLKFLAEEMQAVSKGLEKVVQELSMSENDGPVSEEFSKILKEFLSFAEAEVRSLAGLYSGVGRNVDALILYFGEDPSRCTFEQVVSTLLNFVRMFNRAHEENCKQLELEKKKAEKEAENEKLKANASQKKPEDLLHIQIKSIK